MSTFLDKLIEFIDQKNLTFSELGRRSGIDKSHLNKIKNENIKTPSFETLSKIIGTLQLDPVEEKEFLTAYKITNMGENNYYRRQEVLKFFNSVSPSFFKTNSTEILRLNIENIPLEENGITYEGENRVNALVYKVILKELNNPMPGAVIQLIVQPEYKFLFEILCTQDLSHDCKIRHILCMDNKEATDVDGITHNLNNLKVVTDLVLAQCKYEPFYFYGSVNSHFRNNMLLPYLIVTSNYAIQLSHDLKYAVYHPEKSIVNVFQKFFNNALDSCNLMIQSFSTINDGLQYYINQCSAFGYPVKGCNGEPCLTAFLTPEIIQRHLTDDERAVNFLEVVSRYMSIQADTFHPDKLIEYFSIEGLEYFLKTGLLWQIPDYVLKPLSLQDRYNMLNEFYKNRIDTQTFMLKKDSPLSLGKLEVVTWVKGNISFIYEHLPDEYTSIFLLEKSLSFAFSDFFDYIGNIGGDKKRGTSLDNDIAYSNEETMDYIIKRISELSNKL